MAGDIVNAAKQNFAEAAAAGSEATAGYLLSLAVSPMGLALIACVVIVTLWRASG